MVRTRENHSVMPLEGRLFRGQVWFQYMGDITPLCQDLHSLRRFSHLEDEGRSI